MQENGSNNVHEYMHRIYSIHSIIKTSYKGNSILISYICELQLPETDEYSNRHNKIEARKSSLRMRVLHKYITPQKAM